MKTSLRWLVLTLFVMTAIAQTSTPPASTDSGLKMLGFGFTARTSTRLDLVEVPNTSPARPTAPFVYGAEYGIEPTKNSQYYQYNKRDMAVPYATLRVKNEGAKVIKSVVWEYTDPHFKGKNEVGYSEVKTKLLIPAGQEATLTVRVPEHDRCGDATKLAQGIVYKARICRQPERRMTNYYLIEARLKQVNYADGSVWKAN